MTNDNFITVTESKFKKTIENYKSYPYLLMWEFTKYYDPECIFIIDTTIVGSKTDGIIAVVLLYDESELYKNKQREYKVRKKLLYGKEKKRQKQAVQHRQNKEML